MKSNYLPLLAKISIIIVSLFGLFIVYQVIKMLLGGSWERNDMVIPLLIFNLGALFSIAILLATFISDLKHLSQGFNPLAGDFKEHLKNHQK